MKENRGKIISSIFTSETGRCDGVMFEGAKRRWGEEAIERELFIQSLNKVLVYLFSWNNRDFEISMVLIVFMAWNIKK